MDLTHFRFTVEDGVATVLLDRAGEAMNTLGPELLDDIGALLEQLESDDEIVAVVLGSAKPDNFLAGADLRWFGRIEDPREAETVVAQAHEQLNRFEALHAQRGKPVVAAIHGPALGGGLELALTASMRIATDDAKTQLGQPEVQVGVLPAGGGTQRLPRLIGIAAALDLILTGRAVRAKRAHKLGIVDEVVPQEVLLEIAKERALAAAASPAAVPSSTARLKTWLAPSHLQQLALEENPLGRRLLFSKAEERMLAETKGNYPAPKLALEAVRIGIEEGTDAGLAAERRFFAELVVSPQSKALRSIFFATQALKKDSGIEGDATPREIDKVGILGGGLMGGGIAAVSALRADTSVRIKEVDEAGVRRGLSYVRKAVEQRVKRRRLTRRQAEQVINKVTATTDFSGFGNVDLVIEAVFESLDLKRSILQEVEGVIPEGAVFASNTSSLPITDIAVASQRPEQVIGMHYFSPVERMPLLEVVTTEQTADWVTATCVAFGKQQGKNVIVVNDGAGFYTTRILGPYSIEAAFLLEEGASVEAIDDAMVQWGFPVGPLLLMDEVGIDVGGKIAEVMVTAFGQRMQGSAMMANLVIDDRRGRKNGRGFYTYERGERGGVDETVYDVLGLGPRQEIPAEQIQERIALAMINEAALCLEENILRSARDGDIGAVMGLGFPPFRGGPFWYVDEVGAKEVVAKLDALAEEHGGRFRAADVLREHAEEGRRFRS